MTIHYLKGDATYPVGTGPKIIAHVCNDIGAWGKGFVLAVSKRWKTPEEEYRMRIRREGLTLGEVHLVQVEHNLWVANLVAQHGIAGEDGIPPIRYPVLRKCLQRLAIAARRFHASVHMPRIGCGLAGGTWEMIALIIEEELNGLSVTVYDL